MENAVDALKIGFAVLVFAMALFPYNVYVFKCETNRWFGFT